MNKIKNNKRPIIVVSNSIKLEDAIDLMLTDKLAYDFPYFMEGCAPIYGGNCYNANLNNTPYSQLFPNPNPAQALYILLMKLGVLHNIDHYSISVMFLSFYDKFTNEQLKD